MSQGRDGIDQGSGRVSFDLAVSLLDEAMTQGQAITLRPRGGSMYPAVCPDDKVIAQRAAPDETRVGDIILYRRQDWIVVHRIVSRRRVGLAWQIQTLGDATLTLDPPIDKEDLLGRVVRIERGEQVFALDRRRWRWLGWGLAGYLRLAARFYRGVQRLGLRGWGLCRLHRLLTLPERAGFKILQYRPGTPVPVPPGASIQPQDLGQDAGHLDHAVP